MISNIDNYHNEILQLNENIQKLVELSNLKNKENFIEILINNTYITKHMFDNIKIANWANDSYYSLLNDSHDDDTFFPELHVCYSIFLEIILNINIGMFNNLFTYIDNTFDEIYKFNNNNEKQKYLSLFQYDLKFNISNNIETYYNNSLILNYFENNDNDNVMIWYLNYYTVFTNEDHLIIHYYNPIEDVLNVISKHFTLNKNIISKYLIYFNKLKKISKKPSHKLIEEHFKKIYNNYDNNKNDYDKLLIGTLFSWTNYAYPYTNNHHNQEIMWKILKSDIFQNEINYIDEVNKYKINSSLFKINNSQSEQIIQISESLDTITEHKNKCIMFNNVNKRNSHFDDEIIIDIEKFNNDSKTNKFQEIISEKFYKINNKKYNSIYDIAIEIINDIPEDLIKIADDDLILYIANNYNFTILFNENKYENIKMTPMELYNNNLKIKIEKENNYYIVLCSEKTKLNSNNKITI